ncbi:MFS transporter [Xenophilus sp. Marseille-Q4582]|uniref:MFS transporter n=1 Tax=Xenophilus sp. Marseille-Q4582 TaxID=2866600 RepID=UPI001CE3F757|nr:MFS transporter [Xenophilus sp. Marseille-Q4582]
MSGPGPAPATAPATRGSLLAFAGLSASYFAHIGFLNPYLPLWLQSLGLPLITISLLTSVQSLTRVFAPYAWGALSDHLGDRVLLLRISAAVALVASLGLFWNGGPWWIFLVLLVMFIHTGSMMSLTEAALAQLVAGDWGRYGRIRMCGSAGFLVTVFVAGVWFDRFGMGHFPATALLTLGLLLLATLRLPAMREPRGAHSGPREPVMPVLRQPAVRWFFASLFFHVTAHFSVYGFVSLYLDALGYSKGTIGLLWAVSVVAEVLWFWLQGHVIGRLRMPQWLLLCGVAAVLRLGLTAGMAHWLWAVVLAQLLHALSFAAHHTTCVALVSRHFTGQLRGRGQALFTVIGYGFGGVIGVLAGGAAAQRFGFAAMFGAATALAAIGSLCAWRVQRLERPAARHR